MYKRDVVMFDLVSLTVGISPLPLADGLVRDIEPRPQLGLGHPPGLAGLGNKPSQFCRVHGRTSFDSSVPEAGPFGNRPIVEAGYSG